MSERAITRMTAEAFLEWCKHQEGRYELIDGAPVAMTGARQRHDLVVMNVQASLHGQLRGGICRNFSADIAVRIPSGNVRRPDAGVDCAPFDEDATTAGAPLLVLEVLSPSTRQFDLVQKLEEYKSVPGLSHIVLIDPDIPRVIHWTRAADANWRSEILEGLDHIIRVPEIDCVLPVSALYEGLTFRPVPRLVQEG